MWGFDSVEGVVAAQELSSPMLDKFFLAFTDLGDEIFFMVGLGFVFWCLSKRFGMKLLALFMFSTMINATLKVLFQTPRPYLLYPDRVTSLAQEASWSFPSGHTQGTTTFWGIVGARYRKLIPVGVVVVALVAFSRVYLGVHYPIDLVGGLVLGLGVVGVGRLFSYSDDERGVRAALLFSVLAGGALAAVAAPRDPGILKFYAVLVGAEIGFMVEERWVRFRESAPWAAQAGKLLIGAALGLAVKAGLKIAFPDELLFDSIRYLCIGLVTTAVAPWLFVRLRLAGTEFGPEPAESAG